MPSNAKKTTKTTDKKVAAKKTTTAAKKAPAKKTAAKPEVKKTATTKTAAKPAAKKAVAAKAPAKKAAVKPVAKKTATTKTAAKPAAKKAVATKAPAKKVEVKKVEAKKPEVKVEAKKEAKKETSKKISTNAILGIVFGSIAAVAVVVAIIIIAINAGKANITRNRQAGDLKFYLPESFTAQEPNEEDSGVTYSYTQGESLIGTSVMVGIYNEMEIDQALEVAEVDSTYQVEDKTIDGITWKAANASLSIFGITMDSTAYVTNQNGKTYLAMYILVNPTQEDKDIKDKFTNSLTFKDVKVEEVANVVA